MTGQQNVSGAKSLGSEVAVTSGISEALRIFDGVATDKPDTTAAICDVDLHELTASLIEAQRARVFKARQEERASGNGLIHSTSVEIKRLMSMLDRLHHPASSL